MFSIFTIFPLFRWQQLTTIWYSLMQDLKIWKEIRSMFKTRWQNIRNWHFFASFVVIFAERCETWKKSDYNKHLEYAAPKCRARYTAVLAHFYYNEQRIPSQLAIDNSPICKVPTSHNNVLSYPESPWIDIKGPHQQTILALEWETRVSVHLTTAL